MNKKPVRLTLSVLVCAFALGCGGSRGKEPVTAKLLEDEPKDVDLVAHLTGIDETTPVEVEQEPEQAQPVEQVPEDDPAAGEHVGGSMGVFVGTLKLVGEPIDGEITIKTADSQGTVVKEGVDSGSEVRLAPGVYDIVFTTKKLIGDPELSLRDVEITAGRKLTRDLKVPAGEITLVTPGKGCKRIAVRIKPKGATDWYPGKQYTCKPIKLLAGEYEAEYAKGKGGTLIKGIQVYDGGKRDITIRTVK